MRDSLIRRFTTDLPTLDAVQELAAIVWVRGTGGEENFLICDAVTGQRLGNFGYVITGKSEGFYRVVPEARGRGVATRVVTFLGIRDW
ncbi:hypothetical protein AB0J71_48890 [Nonomuraea sp. NPDC049637]|uniref:hypothetical protein n=1 Tax=Nonomuraea sp. NPDC049637 TaxID=3154356 RepID=UPI0034463317